MAYEFQGTDRRAIVKALDMLQWIRTRDDKARFGGPTRSLSTRQVVIDGAGQVISEAFAVFAQRFSDALDLLKGETLAPSVLDNGKKYALLFGANAILSNLGVSKLRAGCTFDRAEVDALTLTFKFISTLPGLVDNPLALVYNYNDAFVLQESFIVKCDEIWQTPTTDLWFDRTA